MLEEVKDPEVLASENDRQEIMGGYLEKANFECLLDKSRVRTDEKPAPLNYLLRYVDGQCDRALDFLHRGGIIMLNGQKGCRKSTLARALCNILLNGTLDENCPTITTLQPGLKVAVIDTEQFRPRIYAHAKWLQRGYKGTAPFDERLQYYSVRGYDPDTIFSIIAAVCENTRPDVLFIDVFSNLVNDINDQKESKKAVDFIYQICEFYNVAVIGVMHQNPTKEADPGNKMAGSLGTQIERAASCVLNVAKVAPGVDLVDNEGNGLGYVYNKSSIVTFTALRDREPDVKKLLLTNENEKGDFALSLQPVKIEKDGKGFAKKETLHQIPAHLVDATLRKIRAEEEKRNSPTMFE